MASIKQRRGLGHGMSAMGSPVFRDWDGADEESQALIKGTSGASNMREVNK